MSAEPRAVPASGRLCLRLELLLIAGAEGYSPAWEPWGRLHLLMGAEGASTPMPILRGEWRLDRLVGWLIDNGAAFCHDALDIEGRRPGADESLSEAYDRLLDDILPLDQTTVQSPEQDRWHDSLHAYYERHMIGFGLPGAGEVPPVMLGCNRGQGEIFLNRSDGERWAHAFDMGDFLADLWLELRRFLKEWQATTGQDWAREHAALLLARLGDPPQGCCRG